MCTIKARLDKVLTRIRQAEIQFERAPNSVKLLAVSKTKPLSEIQAAINCGQLEFGENYLQDALSKIKALNHNKVKWHFIGHVQSNKARQVAENFSWVHTVDSIKLARRLSRFVADGKPALNVCIQINISNEKNKSGCNIESALELAQEIEKLENLNLRGLMAIPMPETDFAAQRSVFRDLNSIYQDFKAKGIKLDTLSIGMSADLEAAIAEGATIVRVGTDIFGPRS